MSAGEGPPDPGEKKAAPLSGTRQDRFPGSAEVGSCFQNIRAGLESQSRLASVVEAAEILGENLPEYVHQDSSEWSDGWNWRDNKASFKQIECLRKFGIDARGAGMGHASRLIGKLIKRKQKGLASFSDIRWLGQHGVENARKLTSHEARQLIEIISYEQMEATAQRFEGGVE